MLRAALSFAVLGALAACGGQQAQPTQQTAAASPAAQPARSFLKSLECKPDEWKAPPYATFPFFLQKVLWSSRQFYSPVGEDYQERFGTPYVTDVPVGTAKSFEAAAKRYVEASETLWGSKDSSFRAPDLHRRTFLELLKHYPAERDYARRLQSAVEQRTGLKRDSVLGDAAHPSGLLWASAQPEIILLTAALNLALIQGGDAPIDQALARILDGKSDASAVYRNISDPSGCLGCSANEHALRAWLPDSLKSGSGTGIWKVLLFRHMRQSIKSPKDVEAYAAKYRDYTFEYDIGRLYPSDADRKMFLQFIYQYYEEPAVRTVVDRGVCNEFAAPLLWDRDLLKISKKYGVNLGAK